MAAGKMELAFNRTVKASKEIDVKLDASAIEAGRTIAAQIDFARDNLEGQDLTKALYLTPHLMNILKELLATPASRRAAGLKENEEQEDALADLLSIDGGRVG